MGSPTPQAGHGIEKMLLVDAIKRTLCVGNEIGIYAMLYASFVQARKRLRQSDKTPDGSKQILIEIQKAKFAMDIMRFRRYLGDQYASRANVFTEKKDKKEVQKALPIPREHTQAPPIKVKRH